MAFRGRGRGRGGYGRGGGGGFGIAKQEPFILFPVSDFALLFAVRNELGSYSEFFTPFCVQLEKNCRLYVR